MRLRSIVASAFAFAVVTSSANAHASGDPEKLFAEGSALIGQGRCAEALPMLEEAQRLDPGIGTQFNIAVCQQQLGRLENRDDRALVVQRATAPDEAALDHSRERLLCPRRL